MTAGGIEERWRRGREREKRTGLRRGERRKREIGDNATRNEMLLRIMTPLTLIPTIVRRKGRRKTKERSRRRRKRRSPPDVGATIATNLPATTLTTEAGERRKKEREAGGRRIATARKTWNS